MLPVEILSIQDSVVLRARGSELLIMPHHVKELKDKKDPRSFSEYFMRDALVNRPARKLFEAWLRKDGGLWRRLFDVVKDLKMTEAGEEVKETSTPAPVAGKSKMPTTEKGAGAPEKGAKAVKAPEKKVKVEEKKAKAAKAEAPVAKPMGKPEPKKVEKTKEVAKPVKAEVSKVAKKAPVKAVKETKKVVKKEEKKEVKKAVAKVQKAPAKKAAKPSKAKKGR